MLFLVLALLSSSVLAMVLKYLNTSSPYGVFLVNYITCTLLAFGAMEPKTLYNGDLTPCWLGAATGLIYLASLSANGYSIHQNGAILSSVFTRLGVLVPILLSVALFGERPTLVQGVGIATFVSNCISFLYFLGVLWKIRGTTAVTIHPAAGLPGPRSIGQVFWVGIPSAVTSFLFDLDYMVIDKLMVTYSEEALAAIGIVLKVERLPLNVGIGICQGMMPLVAYNCAAGNQKRMDQVVRLSLLTGLVVGAGSILLYEAFAPWIIRVFISDAQTVGLATSFIRIRILGTPLMFLSFFTVYLFQGFGKGGISLVLAIARWAVFNIPMIFLLNHLVGMYGIIWSPIVGDTLTVLVSIYAYCTQKPQLESRT